MIEQMSRYTDIGNQMTHSVGKEVENRYGEAQDRLPLWC